MNDFEIKEKIIFCFDKYFSSLNPRLKLELSEIVIERFTDIYTNKSILYLKLSIRTNNAYYLDKTAGIFLKFQGYLQMYFELLGCYAIKVKFLFEPYLTEQLQEYQDIPISDLIKCGLLDKASLYYKKMQQYKIKILRLIENKIAGPGLGMIELIEREFKNRDIQRVADLFAGSLGYSIITHELGAACIDSYDLKLSEKPEYAEINLYEQDLLDFKIPDRYDLILIDPPKKLHIQYLQSFMNWKLKAVALFRAGSSRDLHHVSKIDDLFKQCNQNAEKFELYNETLYRLELIYE